MKTTTINYKSLGYLKSLLDSKVEILDVYVENKWLVAILSSGVKMMVINNPVF